MAINNKRAPQAHQIILTNNNIDDGWSLLVFTLLTKCCPFLGDKYMVVVIEITLFLLYENDTIHFLQKGTRYSN